MGIVRRVRTGGPSRGLTVFICLLLAACAACAKSDPARTAPVATSPHPQGAPTSGPIHAPHTTVAQDQRFFTDTTEADPGLVSYEKEYGNVALRALLTDGTAFCALLQRGDELDEALVTVAGGARSEESQTHLPLSVTTFNTVESVALLTLCPATLKQLPSAVRAKVNSLGTELSGSNP